MGALDVCPFVPVSGVTMEDCINCSNVFGSRLSKELDVPLYLYEYSCTGGDHRRTLPQIRAGEYEKLKDKVMYLYIIHDCTCTIMYLYFIILLRRRAHTCTQCTYSFFLISTLSLPLSLPPPSLSPLSPSLSPPLSPSLFLQITKSEWTPDYGPAQFIPSWGATVTGARPMLIAYNVNLLGTKQQAHRIALDIREQGRGPDNVRHISTFIFKYIV